MQGGKSNALHQHRRQICSACISSIGNSGSFFVKRWRQRNKDGGKKKGESWRSSCWKGPEVKRGTEIEWGGKDFKIKIKTKRGEESCSIPNWLGSIHLEREQKY